MSEVNLSLRFEPGFSTSGLQNTTYASIAFDKKYLKIMLLLSSYAKNYASTIDSSLLSPPSWTD